MNKFFLCFSLLIAFPINIFAGVYFTSLLPNPAGDDTVSEYIDFRNTGCSDVDIGGYELRDLQKGYTFPTPTLLTSKSTLRLMYATSKISLNNSWLETITLRDRVWSIVDTYSYSGTQRDDIVLSISHIDDICEAIPPPPIELTWSITSSGTEVPPSVPVESTGTVVWIWANQDSSVTEWTWIVFSSSGTTNSWEILTVTGGESTSWVSITGSTWSIFVSGWDIPPELPTFPQWETGTGNSNGTNWMTSEGDTFTWVTEETPSMLSTETGTLVASEVYYSDEDANNHIDTLEIIYPYVLTGTVNTWSIFLYSRSGGLSVDRINTLTWYILSGSLSGSTLILSLREWDIEKLELHINDSTTSDLRLKSLGDLGFRSIGWQEPEPFYLTSSFANYENVIYKEYIYEQESPWENTGSLSSTGEEVPIIHFPGIFPTLQSPTNASFFSGAFLCDTSPCRINLTFTTMFSSGYTLGDFACYIGTGWLLSLEADCNPDTYYFTSSGSITIELVSKIDPNQKSRQDFNISWSKNEDPPLPPWKIDVNPPIIVLEHDGKWHTYYREISPYEFECYTTTCALNMTAEHSYDPEWGVLRYMWLYDGRDLTEKKDPGEKRFWIGEHTIWLRVVDTSENMSEVYFHINVLGEEEKEIASAPKKKSSKKASVTKDVSLKKKTTKKAKKVEFFDPPEILLQSTDSASKRYDGYTCYTTTKTCSFNFALSSTVQDIIYTWEYDNGTKLTSKNPKSLSLSPGKHEIILTASYDGSTPLWSKALNLSVQTIKKATKKKVAIKKKTWASKIKEETTSPKEMSSFELPEENPHFPVESLYLVGGIGWSYLIRRKFFRT